MWTWLLLVVGVPLLLGWAQSRLYCGFGGGVPSSVGAGVPEDDEPSAGYWMKEPVVDVTGNDTLAPLTNTDTHAATAGAHEHAWASSDDTHKRNWPADDLQHTPMEIDENRALGDVVAPAAFCPTVNIDGTPMVTCWLDIEGKPYGVTDPDGPLRTTAALEDDHQAFTHNNDCAIDPAGGTSDNDCGSGAAHWVSDDWASGNGWHDSRW